MSIEDDLFGMFKHFKIGGGADINSVLRTMVRNVQIGVLKQMRKQIDDHIKALSGTEVGLDPYEILGIKSNATMSEVKRAFRKRSFETHPDRGGSKEEFIKVNAAYEAICRVRGW